MLSRFFEEHPKVAVAFSGGVDSAYLLYAAKSFGAEVKAYYVKSAFQPRFELEDARRLCRQLQVPLCVIELDILRYPEIVENSPRRCYYCKKQIFTAILHAAEANGFSVLLDGTNASDDSTDRPGMRALKELSVLSPLREVGLTKDKIRLLSKEAGLFTHNKPAYACLATRIRQGEPITAKKLIVTEQAEDALFKMGLRSFRVRLSDETAKLQVPASQMDLVMENRMRILSELSTLYKSVTLDLEARE